MALQAKGVGSRDGVTGGVDHVGGSKQDNQGVHKDADLIPTRVSNRSYELGRG